GAAGEDAPGGMREALAGLRVEIVAVALLAGPDAAVTAHGGEAAARVEGAVGIAGEDPTREAERVTALTGGEDLAVALLALLHARHRAAGVAAGAVSGAAGGEAYLR